MVHILQLPISTFYSTIVTKSITPCERARKTKPEKDFVSFVAFCLRYLGHLERRALSSQLAADLRVICIKSQKTCQIFSDKYHLGTPIPNPSSEKGEICSFTINASSKKEGEIMTPTYPGTYPKNMECSYKFIGEFHRFLDVCKIFEGRPRYPRSKVGLAY